MHRSGTSALSGVLEPLGLTVGKTVMPPNAGNPKGYYENNALMELHANSWLHRLGLATP